MPPVTPPDTLLRRLKLAGLADTLRRLASAGRRDFYEGEIAAAIAKDIHAIGGVLGPEDLAQYRARIVVPTECDYRGATIALAPRLTAGPSMAWALARLADRRFERGGPHADAFVAYAEALREAYAQRLQTMGESEGPRPVEHDPSQRHRPRRQHGGPHADAALGVRQQGRPARHGHPDEQRRHVVRSAPRRTEFASARQTAAHQTCAR